MKHTESIIPTLRKIFNWTKKKSIVVFKMFFYINRINCIIYDLSIILINIKQELIKREVQLIESIETIVCIW